MITTAPELIYMLKVNIGIALFYAFYKLFCCRDTFFQWRRIALLSFLALSFLYPLMDMQAPAREVFLGGGVGAFGVDESDGQHGRKIDDHGQQNPEIVGQLRPLPNHDAKRLPPWQELCADMRADMRLTPERRHTDRHSREYGRNALRLMVVDTRAQAPSTVSILRRCFIRAPHLRGAKMTVRCRSARTCRSPRGGTIAFQRQKLDTG